MQIIRIIDERWNNLKTIHQFISHQFGWRCELWALPNKNFSSHLFLRLHFIVSFKSRRTTRYHLHTHDSWEFINKQWMKSIDPIKTQSIIIDVLIGKLFLLLPFPSRSYTCAHPSRSIIPTTIILVSFEPNENYWIVSDACSSLRVFSLICSYEWEENKNKPNRSKKINKINTWPCRRITRGQSGRLQISAHALRVQLPWTHFGMDFFYSFFPLHSGIRTKCHNEYSSSYFAVRLRWTGRRQISLVCICCFIDFKKKIRENFVFDNN